MKREKEKDKEYSEQDLLLLVVISLCKMLFFNSQLSDGYERSKIHLKIKKKRILSTHDYNDDDDDFSWLYPFAVDGLGFNTNARMFLYQWISLR